MASWSDFWLARSGSALFYCSVHFATRYFSLARVLAVLRASLSDQSPIRYTSLCVALFARHYLHSRRVTQLMTSNQALERTADRRDNLLSMTSLLKPEAQLAIISGRSA